MPGCNCAGFWALSPGVAGCERNRTTRIQPCPRHRHAEATDREISGYTLASRHSRMSRRDEFLEFLLPRCVANASRYLVFDPVHILFKDTRECSRTQPRD